ncbi:unnamed protein product [Spirodela intermedia]|uniref:Uncharacterized protein n=1 Tax=Spirodela intermedia TaxID=51605 RepID=A0A7I8J7M9_SPIIN|nr:unnamed protein product [Spirodela intermedia]CAA6665745.1 unnamed protein product [Spirodela intermedia]
MDAETRRRIKETVVEILKGADMAETTELKVRSLASEKLGVDLSVPELKRFVRDGPLGGSGREVREAAVVDGGKELEKAGREEEEEEEEGRENKRNLGERELDDEGNLVVCRLSSKRKVTIQDFRGRTLVSIREFYDKGGKELPSNKGISLTVDQWASFRDAVPSIETAIKKLESRLQ